MGVARCAVTSPARDLSELKGDLQAATERLARTRPTAVNLFWALRRMGDVIDAELAKPGSSVPSVRDRLVREAQVILDEDVAACRALGAFGVPLVPDGARILTHCNAGALATGGFGTALGVVRAAAQAGRRVSVLADETRPFLQGARLTAWELDRDGIPVTVITDNMSAHLMRRGEVDLVVVGADRIAANGDVANKIGTYGLAVLAREHRIPFYVAAPLSTIDLATASGEEIPIEERGREEVAEFGARPVVPKGVPVRHPAFDVTPAALVDAIVTERGVARAPYGTSLASLLQS
jgi:methylthioribose-1-phosphate isomerase